VREKNVCDAVFAEHLSRHIKYKAKTTLSVKEFIEAFPEQKN
jgi:hypothetical protein